MRYLLLSVCAVVLAGCPVDDDSNICTMKFAMLTLDAVDAAGRPVVPTDVTVRRADGTSLVCAPGREDAPNCVRPLGRIPHLPNTVVVASDGVTLRPEGETLAVTATDGTRSGAATLVAGNDGCHVRRVSGDTRIVLR